MKSELIVKHFKKIPATETKALLQQLKAQKIDEQAIDWASCDSENGIDGVKTFIFEQYGINVAETPKEFYERVKSEMERQTLQEDEATRQAEAETSLQEKAELESIKKSKSPTLLRKKFETLRNFVNATLQSGKIHLTIISGGAGIGKSHTILSIVPNPLIIQNKITQTEFYELLFHNPEANIVLDDVNWEMLTEQVMSATATNDKRFVHYHTARTKLPQISEFKGKIVIITNKPKKAIPEPLLSRAYFHEVRFSYSEKIQLLYQVALAQEIPKSIPAFIEANTSPATEDLDFRTLLKIHELSLAFPDDWKKTALSLLQEDELTKLLLELAQTNLTVKEQQRKWTEATGKNRSSYYNYKKKVKGK